MAVASETTRQSPATLVELIGRETLQSIQDAFATAFDIPTVILDHEGRNVNAITFRVAFCEDLTRPSRAGDRCLSCDVRAMRESEVTRRPTTFSCWAGLNDSTVPIVSADGRLFGHFLAGQVHFKEPDSYARWRDLAVNIGVDPDAYEAAAREVRVIPEAVYRHRIDCLGILAGMIADQASAALANRALLDEALSANDQTRRMTKELEAIASSVPLMAGTDDLLATVARLLEAAHDVVAFDGSAVYVRATAHEDCTPILLHDDGGVEDIVYRTGVAAAVETAETVLRDDDATLAIPLILDGDPLGAVVLHRRSAPAFTVHDRDLLTIVGGQVTMAIGVSRLRDESRRVLSVAAARDVALRQMAADVDAEALLRNLLDESLHSLDGRDALLVPRDSSIAAVHRGVAATAPRRLDAAVEGALSRARTTGKPTEARSAGGDTALIIPAAIGSRSGFDLVVWRAGEWTPFDVGLARSLAAGAALIAGAQRRRETSRLDAARQRALAALIGALQRDEPEAVPDLEAQMAAASGVDAVLRARSSDIPGVLIISLAHVPDVPVEHLVVTQGNAALRTPAPAADPAQWDGWGQRILAVLDLPLSGEATCVPIPEAEGQVALIGISATQGDDVRARLQTLSDLLSIAERPSGSAHPPEGAGLLFESVFMAARDGRAAVVDAAIATYRALGGQHDPFAPGTDPPDDLPAEYRPRFERCLTTALSIADDVDTAADVEAAASRAKATVEQEAATTRSLLDRTWRMINALDSERPAVELVERISAHWRTSVLLEDAEGWKVAGDDGARTGAAIELIDGEGRMAGRLWSDERAIPLDSSWEQLAATITLRRIATTQQHGDAVRAAVVDGLIDADSMTPDLLRRCTEVGFDSSAPHRACVIGIDDAESASARVMHWLARWIEDADRIGIVGRRDRNAILIGPDDPAWFGSAVDALIARFPGIHAGLGHPGIGAPGLQRSYSSGRQASDVLRVTGRHGLLEIQDDSLESILLEAADPARLVRFVEAILQPIEEYDARKGAELMHSLDTAAQMNWNLQGAARTCHVHVTTFRYRLTRIEQLTGLNLTGADGRLTAELALRARRVLS